MTIILFIIILAILILVHEFGHFIVAKKSGIRVDEFGLGFPPKIASKKIGETTYTLNAIPFGGFVKIFGEDPHSEEIKEIDKPRSFFYKPKWIQALVLVAGITFNIMFAWILISIGFMIGLPSPVGHSQFGEVQNPQVVITSVLPKSPAAVAGLKAGDAIIFADIAGKAVENLTSENISKSIVESKSGDVTFLYKRGSDVPKTAIIKPSTEIIKDRRAVGISMETIGTLKLPVHLALLEGARSTYFLTVNTAKGLASFLWQTIKFKSDLSQVSGPIGIAGVVGEASHLGFVYLLSLVALISINLAIINLVPFPALDGGRLLFVAIEAIIRRPIPGAVARWTNAVGFALLLILMVVVSAHDIFKLF